MQSWIILQPNQFNWSFLARGVCPDESLGSSCWSLWHSRSYTQSVSRMYDRFYRISVDLSSFAKFERSYINPEESRQEAFSKTPKLAVSELFIPITHSPEPCFLSEIFPWSQVPQLQTRCRQLGNFATFKKAWVMARARLGSTEFMLAVWISWGLLSEENSSRSMGLLEASHSISIGQTCLLRSSKKTRVIL